MFGILNLHKPTGVTSRDVVNQVQRLVRPVKVGHAGTLDPLAEGVLVVCVGPATRLVPYVQQMPKRYRGTFLFGRQSDTEDTDGRVTILEDAKQPTRAELDAAIPGFCGTILQRPPAYSAVKVAGKRAYTRARQGETVELAERPVDIHDLRVVRYDYPQLVMDIECGSGTYIRSLGRDLARQLRTEAVMSALIRTGVGCFQLDGATDPHDLERSNITEQLLSPLLAVSSLPTITLSAEEALRIGHGLSLSDRSASAGEVAAVDDQGQLLAILVPRQGGLGPLRNFAGST